MRKTAARAMLLAAVWVMAETSSAGQKTKPPVDHGPERLRMVVLLSRHGVRSPTWTEDRLDSYSVLPWPKWSVPPGDLTSRGYELVKQFASYDRASLAGAGLLAASGCEDAAKTYIWADTDQRTMASGKALAEGFFSGCPLQVHGLAAGVSDPLFHPAANGVKPVEADAAFAELSRRAQQQKNAQQDELIQEVQHVLLGCDPKIACTPVHAPQMLLQPSPADSGDVAVRGKGDHRVDLEGPLPLASTFAEDFLLEYTEGMAMDQVGWGKVDEAQLRRFLQLHSDYFDLMHHTPMLARLEASNLLLHIAHTLQQAAERKPVNDAIGPVGAMLVVLAGHDTNIAGVAALLGVHWDLDGRHDDTPPGTELGFELWQDARGVYSVRVTIAVQTLQQMREMQALTPAAPPAHATLTVQGCKAIRGACQLADFSQLVGRATRAAAGSAIKN